MMFSDIDRPKKWSTRNTWLSGTRAASFAFSSWALVALLPKGFSRARMRPGGRSTADSDSHAFAAIAGGTAK